MEWRGCICLFYRWCVLHTPENNFNPKNKMDWFGGTFQNWRWGIAWKANWINAERITYKPILKFIKNCFLHIGSLQNMFFLVLATLRPVRIALQPWFPTGLYACWRDADCWMAWWGASLWHFRLQRPHRKCCFHLTYWFSMAMIVTVLILDSAMTQNPKTVFDVRRGMCCAVLALELPWASEADPL